MAANVQTMFYAGAVPWHKQGVKVESEITAADAIVKAGLTWAVSKLPVSYLNPVTKKQTVIRDQWSMTRSDNGQSLGIVGNVYRPLQNVEAFSFFDAVVGAKEAIYHTAGALGQGEKIWILAKVGGVCRIKNTDDTVEKFLLLSNSHDGSSGVRVCLTPVRVVCQNTLYQALASADTVFKIRHSASMGGKVQDVRDALGIVSTFFDDFQMKANALASKQVNSSLFDAYLEGLGFNPDAKQGREAGQVAQLKANFEKGMGNDMAGVKGTAWTAYNAVTQYLTHERSTRVTDGFKSEDEARLNSLWFGSSQKLNAQAWDKALALVA